MIFQYQLIPVTVLTPLIELFVDIFVLFIAIYNYRKLRIYELALLCMLMSVIFFLISIQQELLPFSPYIQLFILLVQLIIFYNVHINREGRKKK